MSTYMITYVTKEGATVLRIARNKVPYKGDTLNLAASQKWRDGKWKVVGSARCTKRHEAYEVTVERP